VSGDFVSKAESEEPFEAEASVVHMDREPTVTEQ
jgi:hypothetical protein